MTDPRIQISNEICNELDKLQNKYGKEELDYAIGMYYHDRANHENSPKHYPAIQYAKEWASLLDRTDARIKTLKEKYEESGYADATAFNLWAELVYWRDALLYALELRR